MAHQCIGSVVAAPIPPRVPLTERLAAVAWKRPDPHMAGPPPAALDSLFPFQVCVCELCGSVCSPLMLHYRDTATILYRVQQHCRKLVPQVIAVQTAALEQCRAAQRGVLDVTDSLDMVDILNGPVQASFRDVERRAKHCAAMLKQQASDLRAEEQRKERRRTERLNAASSLPTTPVDSSEPRVPNTPSSASIPHLQFNYAPAAPSTPSAPRRQHPNTPVPLAINSRSNSNGFDSPGPASSPRASRSGPSTPSHGMRVRALFSPTAPVVREEDQLDLALDREIDSLHPLALGHEHDEHAHDPSISPFVP